MHFKLNELICHSLKFASMSNVVKALISSLFSKIQTVSENGWDFRHSLIFKEK